MHRRFEEFRRFGTEVLVVTQSRPDVLAEYLSKHSLPFPTVADPDRAAYRAFGLARTSWGKILRPDVLLRYARIMLRGWRPGKLQESEDVLQLGGDFVLDGTGRLIYAYRSAEPTDRPSIEAMLRAVREARRDK